MRGMILAAGLGTRLRPITNGMPKPLVPVVGTPNIVFLIRILKDAGIEEIVLNLHHLPDILKDALGDGHELGVTLAYSYEKELLGTGGGIKQALSLLGDSTFVVLNGDALFAPDIGVAVKEHKSSGALATMVVREDPESDAYGAVGLDKDGYVCSLVWAGQKERALKHYMFTGMHVLEPEIGELLPQNGCIVRETYIPKLEQGIPIHGLPMNRHFWDLGTADRYLKANVDIVTGNIPFPGFEPTPDGVYIGQSVSLGDGCRLGPGTVICDHSSIAPNLTMQRCVVLPGAKVIENVANAIVTKAGETIKTTA